MGMDLYIDHMVISKEDFEKWKNGMLCLDDCNFKLISREEYDEAIKAYAEDWKKDRPTWEEDYDDPDDMLYDLTYDFNQEESLFTKEDWDNLDVDYYIEEKIIEIDDKIVWVKATYF